MLGESTGPKVCTATYTVVRDDTLSDIAARLLGDPNKWMSIYDANQSLIESVASQHPRRPVFGTSDHGHWIFPGTTLTIPGAPCNTGTGNQPQLSQTSLEVQLLMATGMSQADAETTVKGFGKCLTGAAFSKILDASHLDPGTKATIRTGKFVLGVPTSNAPEAASLTTSVVVPTIARFVPKIGGFVASKVASWLSLGGCILFEAAPKLED